jgi:hypothetical protein
MTTTDDGYGGTLSRKFAEQMAREGKPLPSASGSTPRAIVKCHACGWKRWLQAYVGMAVNVAANKIADDHWECNRLCQGIIRIEVESNDKAQARQAAIFNKDYVQPDP